MADDTTARAEAGAVAAPATGAGAGADEGAMNSCADAEEAARTATARSRTTAARGAIGKRPVNLASCLGRSRAVDACTCLVVWNFGDDGLVLVDTAE